MNAESITRKITEMMVGSKAVELSKETIEKMTQVIQEAINETKPKCNQCKKVIEEEGEDFRKISVEVSWGYESLGKDGDHDTWSLCAKCGQKLAASLPLACVKCKKEIAEVHAILNAKNPHCIYYGDFETAYREEKKCREKGMHCGDEYAVIADRVVCEICYEEITADFQIPIEVSNYFWSDVKIERTNRIAAALDPPKYRGDSLRKIYEGFVPYEDACLIRKLPDANQRIIKAYVSIYRQEFRTKLEDTIDLTFGDGSIKEYSLQKLKDFACSDLLDPTKPKILGQGQTLALGNFILGIKTLEEKIPSDNLSEEKSNQEEKP